MLAALAPFALLLPIMMLPLLLIGAVGAGTSNTAAAGSSLSCEAGSAGDMTHVDATAMKNNQDAADLLNMLRTGANGIDLKGLKFTEIALAAMLGSFEQESHNTFDVIQNYPGKGKSNAEAEEIAKAGPNGLGLAQWTHWDSRAGTLLRYAKRMNMKWSDGRVQTQLLVDELAGQVVDPPAGTTESYRNVYDFINASSDVEEATSYFFQNFEGAGDASGPQRIAYAKEWLEIIKKNGGGTQTVVSTSSSSSCGSSDDGNAVYGGLGDAPTNTRNFGWMCDTKLKICHDGDCGTELLNYNCASYGYQCYWYWLARSYVVHGSVTNPMTATGGGLYDELQGRPEWTTSTAPRPGAGASFGRNGANHVVFVEKVEQDPSGWKIFISEGNYNTDGSGPWEGYNTRWLTKDQFYGEGGSGFFWMKQWKDMD